MEWALKVNQIDIDRLTSMRRYTSVDIKDILIAEGEKLMAAHNGKALAETSVWERDQVLMRIRALAVQPKSVRQT